MSNEAIEIANVLFRDKSTPDKISEFVVSFDGTFDYLLTKKYSSLVVEVTSLSYEPQIVIIEKPSQDSIYSLKFRLVEKPTVLNEILIQAPLQKVIEKEDTTIYKASDFTDGTEEKVQDILKKLPGLEVNEKTGEIKFKGKSIERVLLDGDDLFGFNYTVGTKNMNANSIDEVEAIDDYSENPLLKSIVDSDKVALNLKLKKGKPDFSGNANLGAGLFKEKQLAYDTEIDLLGISRGFKSFGTLQANNVGKNNSPFDYFDYSITEEQRKDDYYGNKEIIPHISFTNELDEERVNVNKLLYGNYNGVFNLNQKLRTRINLFYFKDEIRSYQILLDQYLIGSDRFNTEDSSQVERQPFQIRGDLEIKYQFSKNVLIESQLKLLTGSVLSIRETLQNQQSNFISSLMSDQTFFKHHITITRKFKDNAAIQVLFNYTRSSLNQELIVSPSPFRTTSESQQNTYSAKTTWDARGIMYQSKEKKGLNASIGYTQTYLPLTTSFDNLLKNNLTYVLKDFYHQVTLDEKTSNIIYKVDFKIRALSQEIVNYDTTVNFFNRKFVFEPNATLQYKFSNNTKLRSSAEINFNENQENFFFLRRVMLNHRTGIQNTTDLRLKRTDKIGLSYLKDDFSTLTQIRASLNHERQKGVFLASSVISENITLIRYFNTPRSITNTSINTSISKYEDRLASTIRLTSDYTHSRYLNVINNSDLRVNYSRALALNFFWKTAFDKDINIENTIDYINMSSSSESQKSRFVNSSLSNSLKFIYKPVKLLISYFNWQSYVPNLNRMKSNFMFLDFLTKYYSKSAKWSFYFHIRNLTNTSYFETVDVNDISSSTFRINILPRQIIGGISFSF